MRAQYRARARDDIAKIFEYRAREHSPRATAQVELAIRATLDMLAAHPEFRRKTDHRAAVRRWPMSDYPYTIFYTLDWHLDAITIVRVVTAARVRNVNEVPQ